MDSFGSGGLVTSMGEVSTLRGCGVTGFAGATILLVADWIMLGTLTSGREFNEKWHVLLAEMPRWRLVAGGLAGPIGAWCYGIGFWQVYAALKPAGRRLAFVVFAGFSLSFIWAAGAFHTSFPFVADAWRGQQAAANGVAVRDVATGPSFHYFGLLMVASMAPAAVASALLPYAILWKRTRYPRWFAACNPALLYVLTALFVWVPAPLGGLLVVGAGNMMFLVFFASSTALLWHGGRREESEVKLPNQALQQTSHASSGPPSSTAPPA
jgi:hypothetical protein